MKIHIVAVGTLKETYFKEAVKEYQKRLSKYAELIIDEVAEEKEQNGSEAEINRVKEREGERLLSSAKGRIVVLDKGGETFSSEQLAEYMRGNMARGSSEWSFVIGGSRGLSEAVIARADLTLSFGRVTFPHQLMRVLVAEQLYRAATINNNACYHK